MVALIGMVILLIALGGYLLKTDYFKELQEEPAPKKSMSGGGWWINAVIMVLLPLVMYLWAWVYHWSSKGIAKDRPGSGRSKLQLSLCFGLLAWPSFR